MAEEVEGCHDQPRMMQFSKRYYEAKLSNLKDELQMKHDDELKKKQCTIDLYEQELRVSLQKNNKMYCHRLKLYCIKNRFSCFLASARAVHQRGESFRGSTIYHLRARKQGKYRSKLLSDGTILLLLKITCIYSKFTAMCSAKKFLCFIEMSRT